MSKNFWFSFLGVVAVTASLAVVASGAWLLLRVSSYKDVPEEQWTCMDPFGYGHEVRWESKWPGTDIHVESDAQIELFALSCLPNPKSNCFDNDGWFGAKIDVSGGTKPVSFSFVRDSANVDDSYRHHVRLYWDLARSVIAAFRAGTQAEITTLGRKGEVLKVTKVKLAGFGPEMDKCLATWAKGEEVSALARPRRAR